MCKQNIEPCLSQLAQHSDLTVLSLIAHLTDLQKRTVRIETRLVSMMEAMGYTAQGKVRTDPPAVEVQPSLFS